MRTTQKQLILEYLDEYDTIIPAKMGGRVYHGIMFGSETSKRCRELRAAGILESHGIGKFEVFMRYQPKYQCHMFDESMELFGKL